MVKPPSSLEENSHTGRRQGYHTKFSFHQRILRTFPIKYQSWAYGVFPTPLKWEKKTFSIIEDNLEKWDFIEG